MSKTERDAAIERARHLIRGLPNAIDAGCVIVFDKVLETITTDDLKAIVAETASLLEENERLTESNRQLQVSLNHLRYEYNAVDERGNLLAEEKCPVLKKNKSTEENSQFWDFVEKTSKDVEENFPKWKRGDSIDTDSSK